MVLRHEATIISLGMTWNSWEMLLVELVLGSGTSDSDLAWFNSISGKKI